MFSMEFSEMFVSNMPVTGLYLKQVLELRIIKSSAWWTPMLKISQHMIIWIDSIFQTSYHMVGTGLDFIQDILFFVELLNLYRILK